MPDAETLSQARSRLTIRCDEGEVVLEYRDPARLGARMADGRLRLVQSWTAEGQGDEVIVAFRVRDASSGAAGGDPVQTAERLRREGKPGEALAVLKAYLPKVREQALQDRLANEVRNLEETEPARIPESRGRSARPTGLTNRLATWPTAPSGGPKRWTAATPR